jgi:predicted nucleic acid-binding protein
MILIDAGPLIAIIHAGDPAHDRCVVALGALRGPLLTTWPAFTEAMYLLGAVAGWRGQEPLWRLVTRGTLLLADIGPAMIEHVPALMERYADLPMDLADATLVALAEERDLSRIFTLDHHFRVYRLPRGRTFEVVP